MRVLLALLLFVAPCQRVDNLGPRPVVEHRA